MKLNHKAKYSFSGSRCPLFRWSFKPTFVECTFPSFSPDHPRRGQRLGVYLALLLRAVESLHLISIKKCMTKKQRRVQYHIGIHKVKKYFWKIIVKAQKRSVKEATALKVCSRSWDISETDIEESMNGEREETVRLKL